MARRKILPHSHGLFQDFSQDIHKFFTKSWNPELCFNCVLIMFSLDIRRILCYYPIRRTHLRAELRPYTPFFHGTWKFFDLVWKIPKFNLSRNSFSWFDSLYALSPLPLGCPGLSARCTGSALYTLHFHGSWTLLALLSLSKVLFSSNRVVSAVSFLLGLYTLSWAYRGF